MARFLFLFGETKLILTSRCNLRCPFCFAEGGREFSEPTLEELFGKVDDILKLADSPLFQLSGGEPTLRDDLPELVHYANFLERLANAGLDIVFLQFDGTNDEIFKTLHGREPFNRKITAIKNCDTFHVGVTLVPTIVAA